MKNYQQSLLLKQIDFAIDLISDMLTNYDINTSDLTQNDIDSFHSYIEFMNNLSVQYPILSSYSFLDKLFYKCANKDIKSDMLLLYLDYFKHNVNAHHSNMDRAFCYTLSYVSKNNNMDSNIIHQLMNHTEWTRYEMIEFLNHLTVSLPQIAVTLMKEFTIIPSFKQLTDDDLTHFIKHYIIYSLSQENNQDLLYSEVLKQFDKDKKISVNYCLNQLNLPLNLIDDVLKNTDFNLEVMAPKFNFDTITIDSKYGFKEFIQYCQRHASELNENQILNLFFPEGIGIFLSQKIEFLQSREAQHPYALKFVGQVFNYCKLYNNVAKILHFNPVNCTVDEKLHTLIHDKLSAITVLEKVKFDNALMNNQNSKIIPKVKI